MDRADGVPFVLEELIRSMESEVWRRCPVLPQTVESVIDARLQKLSPTARAMAQALSLLGEHVDVELVETVIGAEVGIS